MEAAETAGFFTLIDHGITIDEINAQFALSEKYFALPAEVKGRIPHSIKTNNGYEYKVSGLDPGLLTWYMSETLPNIVVGTNPSEHRDC